MFNNKKIKELNRRVSAIELILAEMLLRDLKAKVSNLPTKIKKYKK